VKDNGRKEGGGETSLKRKRERIKKDISEEEIAFREKMRLREREREKE
jgi:hypothetical protein